MFKHEAARHLRIEGDKGETAEQEAVGLQRVFHERSQRVGHRGARAVQSQSRREQQVHVRVRMPVSREPHWRRARHDTRTLRLLKELHAQRVAR